MRRLLAGSAVAAVAAGVPTALASTAGGPRVPSFGSFGGLDSTYLPLEPILGVLALMAWVLWIYIALVVVLRAVAVVLARSTGSDAWLRSTDALAPKPLRRLVDLAVGGVFLAASLSVGRAAAGVPVLRVIAASAAITPSAGTLAESHPASQERAYTVRAGDSLWRIAERELGSGFRWNEIYRLNRGHRFADGRYLRDPRLIHPGWILKLPSVQEQRHHERADTPKKRAPRPVERSSPAPSGVVSTPRRAPSPEALTPSPHHTKTERPAPTPADVVVDQPSPSPVVRLPSGAVVATSFACGLLSAELLTRLRRRRRRRPLSSDDVVEMPERLVRDLRSAGAEPTTAPIDVAMDEVGVNWHASTGQWPRFLAAIEGRRSIEVLIEASEVSLPRTSGGRMSPQLRFERAGGVVKAELSGPFPVRLHRISTPMQRGLLVPLGHAGDRTALHIAPLGLGVLSIMGADAGELLRQMLLTQASESAVDDLQIMLLGVERDLALDLPHVTRTLDWDRGSEVLREIQAEFIRRARLFQQEDVEDIWSHLATHSDERLPALLLVVADPPAAMRGLIEAVALEAPRFGGAVIALGWRPAASRLHVIADDDALRLETDLNVPGKLAPFVLDESAIRDAVQLIKRASIEDLEDDAEPESPPHEETVIERSITIELPHVEPLRESQPHIESQPRIELPPRVETPKSVPPEGVPAVHCLGVFEVTRDGRSRVKGWQKKSRELLAYLIAHPDGASKERIMDELFPEAEPRQLQSLFDKALSIARLQVRGPDDLRMYFIRVEETWRLEAGSLWVDAFEFARLIDEAEHARDATESVILLRQAIVLYRGNFCDDLSYPWAEPVRERFRNLFTRASARLAEILADAGENEEALEVLDRAIKIDVLCEDLWRRAMSVESSMGRRAAAADRYKRLRTLLATELNVEPDPETQRLERAIALRSSRSQELDQPSAMSTSNAG